MGKPEIRLLTIQKWLNRSPPNFVWTTMSAIPTNTQNFITIRLGVFDFRVAEIVFTRLFSFVYVCGSFRQARAETVALMLTPRNTSNGVVSRKDVPFGSPVNDAPHLRSQIPKNRSKKA